MVAAEASEEQLAAYLASTPERFRSEDRLTFRHVFLSATRRGEVLEGDAKHIAATLVGATTPADTAALGDPFLLGETFRQTPQSDVARTFATVSRGSWRPLTSPGGKDRSDRVSVSISSSSTNEPRAACRPSTPSGKKSGANG